MSIDVGPWITNGGISNDEMALLSAIAHWMQPRRVLEIGTSLVLYLHGLTS